MRGWMNEGKSYVEPVGVGEVMRARGIGRVVASHNPAFAEGARTRKPFTATSTSSRKSSPRTPWQRDAPRGPFAFSLIVERAVGRPAAQAFLCAKALRLI